MLMSVAIVMKSQSGVYIIQLRFNTEHDKSYFINFKLIYYLN